MFIRVLRNIFLYFINISLGSELQSDSHYFITSKQTPNYIKLFYKKNLIIKSYEIYEADIGDSFNSFMPICFNSDIPKNQNVLFIDISFIDKKIDKEYIIWITYGESKIFYSNTFIYDTEAGYYKFTRRYVQN